MAAIQGYTYASRIFTEPLKAPGMTPGHSAIASLTEVDANNFPIIGDATMKVYNVVPMTGHVIVRGEVDWDYPLRIRISVIYQTMS